MIKQHHYLVSLQRITPTYGAEEYCVLLTNLVPPGHPLDELSWVKLNWNQHEVFVSKQSAKGNAALSQFQLYNLFSLAVEYLKVFIYFFYLS